MRKGLLASVAALAASAGVSLGQYPPAAPATPAGYPVPAEGVQPPPPLPPAGPGDMPHNGLSYGPGNYPNGLDPHQGCEGGDCGDGTGRFRKFLHGKRTDGVGPFGHPDGEQVHKAAGGPDHCWVDLELLLWVVRPQPIPYPLAISAPRGVAPVLGTPGVEVLYGQENIDYNDTNKAFRLSAGVWDECRKWGFMASGFIQEGTTQVGNFAAPRDGRFTIARPFINALFLPDLVPQSYVVGLGVPVFGDIGFGPGVGGFDGIIDINNRIQFGGAEANILKNCAYYDKWKFNLLAGIRYVDIDEQLDITSLTVDPNGAADPVASPNLTFVSDSFGVRNQFLGLNLGFQTELRCGRFFFDGTFKAAFGNTNEHLMIQGYTSRRIDDFFTLQQGGLLATTANITDVKKNEFAIVPEVCMKLGYNISQRCSVTVGYDFLYISRLMRPGDQIDPVVNPVFVPVRPEYPGDFGPVRPRNDFNRTDFWAQGITLGFSVKY